MKMSFFALLICVGELAKASPSKVYARCFDENYATTLGAVIQIHDQVLETHRYNATATLKMNASIYETVGFVRYDQDRELDTFRFFGFHFYQNGRPNGFKFMLGGASFGAGIGFGIPPSFNSRLIKLRCTFALKPFPDYREVH